MNYRTITVKDYGKDWGAGRYGITADCGRPGGEGDVSEGTNDADTVMGIFEQFMFFAPVKPTVVDLIREHNLKAVQMVNDAMGIKGEYPKAAE